MTGRNVRPARFPPAAGIRPKQSLGQNFLTDENVSRKIVRAFRPAAGDIVLEIGAGLGSLTGKLAGTVGHLTVVEIDGRVIAGLRSRFESAGVTVLHEDFLNVDLADLSRRHSSRLRLIGNIPYHLTSPILFKVFDERTAVRDLTIMVQREVARRIAARPGSRTYGILSVFAHFFGEPEVLFDVSPNCFSPRPNVISSVVRISMDETPRFGVDEATFRLVVRTVFGKRRKTLKNCLKYLPYDETVLEKIGRIEFPTDKRPEQLDLEQFTDLVHRIQEVVT